MKRLTMLKKNASKLQAILNRVSIFEALYVSIAVATFRHSAIGFATLEGDNLFWGGLSAIAVDFGMILAAKELQRDHRNLWALIGLLVSAIASTYTQLLFGLASASAFSVAAGAVWMQDYAEVIGNLRIIILPVILPALSVVYSFASKRAKTNPQTWAGVVSVLRSAGIDGGALALALWNIGQKEHKEITPKSISDLTGIPEGTVRAAISRRAQ